MAPPMRPRRSSACHAEFLRWATFPEFARAPRQNWRNWAPTRRIPKPTASIPTGLSRREPPERRKSLGVFGVIRFRDPIGVGIKVLERRADRSPATPLRGPAGPYGMILVVAFVP